MTGRQPWTAEKRISSADDARHVLDALNAASIDRANTSSLARAVQSADDTELTPDLSRLLPVPEALTPLLPWPGLRHGAPVAVTGSQPTAARASPTMR